MKLKTLDDLEIFKTYKKLIKKEAIKWVKRHQAMAMNTEMTEDFIKHFFNITEEDLK